MTRTFKTGVGPAFAFPTEKVIHEARFFDHTGDCKMTHTFKTGDTGLTRDGKHRYLVVADDLNAVTSLAVRLTNVETGRECVDTRFSDGRWLGRLAANDGADLIPPESKENV